MCRNCALVDLGSLKIRVSVARSAGGGRRLPRHSRSRTASCDRSNRVLVGSVVGWAIARFYYRRGKADLDALQRWFDGLQQVVKQAIDRGLVTAERTPAGKMKALGPPSRPTGFSLS